jgi:hypothetical protein
MLAERLGFVSTSPLIDTKLRPGSGSYVGHVGHGHTRPSKMQAGDRIQTGYVLVLWALNIAVLHTLNQRRDADNRKQPSSTVLFGSNYFFLFALLFVSIALDSAFPPSQTYTGLVIITAKATTSSFALALLDFYFSSVEKISRLCILGALTWNLTACVSMWLLANAFGGSEQMKIIKLSDLTNPATLLSEYGRFLGYLLLTGFLTDLVFSPMHRFTHSSRWLYTRLHANHHSFRSRLTSLVLFHGDEVDNILMAACPIAGFAGAMAVLAALNASLPASWQSTGPSWSSLAW